MRAARRQVLRHVIGSPVVRTGIVLQLSRCRCTGAFNNGQSSLPHPPFHGWGKRGVSLRRSAASSFVLKIVCLVTPSLLPCAKRDTARSRKTSAVPVVSGSCVFEFDSLGKRSIDSMLPARLPTNKQTSVSPPAKRRRASPSRAVEHSKSTAHHLQRVALYCALVRRLYDIRKCYTGNTAVQSRTEAPQRTTYPGTSLPGILRTWVLTNAYSQCLTYRRNVQRNCNEYRRHAICVTDAAYDVDQVLRILSTNVKTAMTSPWTALTSGLRGGGATSLDRMVPLPTFSLHSSRASQYVRKTGN